MSIETTLNKPTAKDHTESSEAGGKSPLDSLLSPKGPTFEPPKEASRESVAGSDSELNEVRLDDDSEFSSVPLSARESTASVGSKGSHTSFKSTATHVGNEKEVGHEKENGIEKEERRQTSTSLVPSDSSTLAKPASSHKKSASNSSIKSFVGNTPFILARIESQREQDESDSKVQRASIDGQQKLQEEFAKMQKVKEEEASEAVAGAIDWGVYYNALDSTSIYLTFCRLLGRRNIGLSRFRVRESREIGEGDRKRDPRYTEGDDVVGLALIIYLGLMLIKLLQPGN